MTDPVATRFRVLGVPAPQGSKRAMPPRKPGGRAILVDASSDVGKAKTKAWRTAVAEAAAEAHGDRDAYTGPVSVSIRFVLPRPSGARKADRWQAKKPDLDKLVRATLDGLTDAGVVVDDSRVACLTAMKHLAQADRPATGATITVQPLDHTVSEFYGAVE